MRLEYFNNFADVHTQKTLFYIKILTRSGIIQNDYIKELKIIISENYRQQL